MTNTHNQESTKIQEIETRLNNHDATLNNLQSMVEKNSSQLAEILKLVKLASMAAKVQVVSIQIKNNFNILMEKFTVMKRVKEFNSENLEGWLCKVDQYFDVDETPERLKIRFVVINLEGPALQWHQSFVRSRGGTIRGLLWQDYVRSLTTRFADPLKQDAIGALVALKQTGSLQELCQEFDLWLTRVSLPEDYTVSLFLRAVKPEIGYPVRLLRPKDLPEAYLLARMQDE
ncbi:uncharacterized protein LOC143630666 [Bidens hawaiensis]|uniref:uncharacterized protein LOC143630666 n=1 Tax=Bidens hawaiensis TaxID=980011 RepID=UPI00404A58E3